MLGFNKRRKQNRVDWQEKSEKVAWQGKVSAVLVSFVVATLLVVLPASPAQAGVVAVTSFQNVYSGKCLEVSNFDFSDTAQIVQWDCWGLQPALVSGAEPNRQ